MGKAIRQTARVRVIEAEAYHPLALQLFDELLPRTGQLREHASVAGRMHVHGCAGYGIWIWWDMSARQKAQPPLTAAAAAERNGICGRFRLG
jgi:hypothetical protein